MLEDKLFLKLLNLSLNAEVDILFNNSGMTNKFKLLKYGFFPLAILDRIIHGAH